MSSLVVSDGLALDEAILTGESEPVLRGVDEPVWSGSFALEGDALYEASAVGDDSRAARLAATARAFLRKHGFITRDNKVGKHYR